MKKYLILLAAVFAVLFIGCAGSPEAADDPGAVEEPQALEKQAAAEEPDAVSSATPEGSGWMITLIGVRNDEVYQSDFDAWKVEDGVYVEMELEKKGETNLYGGILLKDIVALQRSAMALAELDVLHFGV